MKNLIGKSIEITNKYHEAYGKTGTIEGVNGEFFRILINKHDDWCVRLTRDEFKFVR